MSYDRLTLGVRTSSGGAVTGRALKKIALKISEMSSRNSSCVCGLLAAADRSVGAISMHTIREKARRQQGPAHAKVSMGQLCGDALLSTVHRGPEAQDLLLSKQQRPMTTHPLRSRLPPLSLRVSE